MSWFKDTKRRLTHKFLEFVGVAGSTRHDIMTKSRLRCVGTGATPTAQRVRIPSVSCHPRRPDAAVPLPPLTPPPSPFRFAQLENTLQTLNASALTYISVMEKAGGAALEFASALETMAASDATRSADPTVAASAEAASRVARATATNASVTASSVKSVLIPSVVERVGDMTLRLRDLAALMKEREDLATDCDAYSRMVRPPVCVPCLHRHPRNSLSHTHTHTPSAPARTCMCVWMRVRV